MTGRLEKYGDAAKAVTALIVLGGMVISGLAFFARASEVDAVNTRVAMVEQAFTEYTTRQTISQIRDAMRQIEDRTGTDDPLQMGSRDRQDYRSLMDELEYYRQILKGLHNWEGE